MAMNDPDSICVACERASIECICIVARCACKQEYTEEGWKALHLDGLCQKELPGFKWDGVGEFTEMRQCVCGSSFMRLDARTVDDDPPTLAVIGETPARCANCKGPVSVTLEERMRGRWTCYGCGFVGGWDVSDG